MSLSSTPASSSSSLLDIREDHFFAENNLSSKSSIDVVSSAIEACKAQVLDTEENSEERKTLVRRIINLKICQQDLLDRRDRPLLGQTVLEIRGHTFVESEDDVRVRGRELLCQACCGRIWSFLQVSSSTIRVWLSQLTSRRLSQAWRKCNECHLAVHATCLERLNRECVAQKVKTQPDLILRICPERSLTALKFRCVECDKKLSKVDDEALPRLCDYTGLWFCSVCHWGSTSVVPARIVHNWDFTPRKVSEATRQYLNLMRHKPVIDISRANPKLFAAVQELSDVREARKKLLAVKEYLVVCRFAAAERLLLKELGGDKHHFVDPQDIDRYSVQDLIDAKDGKLGIFLQGKLDTLIGHIKSCVLCRAKGFVCELCNNHALDGDMGGIDETERFEVLGRGTTLFPFDDSIHRCAECAAVYHRECFRAALQHCPKCERRKKRRTTTQDENA